VEGILVGTMEVRGPISALRTTGDMQLTGDVRGTGSRLAWRGVLDLRNGQVAARSMHADVSNLELALLTAFSPDLHLVGSVSGSVDGSGRMDRLLFTAALDHASADGARSRLDGGGTVTGSGRNRLFDLTVNAIPVSMQDLAAQVPALEGLQGELRGPVHLSGTADDFVFDAGLATEGGDLELSGRVLRAGATQRVIARGTASQFRLHALRPELPETVVTARIDLDVTGDDLATAVGTVYIELDSARHRGMPIGRIRLGGSLADGVLLVDSASLFTAAGIGRASGTVALVASRSGRLEAGFVSESLTPLESRVFGSVSSGAGAEPRLAGRVDVLATVTGWLGSIDIDARGRGENVVWGDLAAERMAVHVEGQSLGNGESTLVVSASADSLTAWAHSFGTAQLDLLQLPDSLSVTGRAAARGEEKLRGRAVLDDVDGATRIRVNDLRIGGLEPWLLESTATALLRSYAGLGVDLHAEAQHGGRSILSAGGRVPLDLRLMSVDERRRDEPLRVTISADSLPPALPLGLLDGFSNVGGRMDGTVTLAGTTLDPALSGGFTIRNGTADWEVSGVRYRDVQGEFTLEGDRVLGINVRAQAADPRARVGRGLVGGTAGGEGTVIGTLDLATLSDPAFNLRFTANRAFAARRRDVEAAITGEVLLGGRYSRPEVSGSLRVDQGVLNVDELYRQYLIVGLELDDPSLLSLVDTSLVAVRPLLAASANPFLRNLQIRNMQVAVGTESWVRSRDMDVEVSGNLNITFDRRDEDLRLLGSLNIERGTYTLYYPPLQSRRFQVREGSIDFPGTPGIDPNMSITAAFRARANNEPLDILAVVSGTLQNPRVRLTSNSQPPISESDLASYLFFGVPTWEVANTGAGGADVRAMAGLGFRALGPSFLGYASSGLQTLVQSAGLLDYVSLTSAEAAGVRNAPGLTSFLAGTQLEVGRYLGSDLFVGYSQRLGTASFDPAVRLEWRFLPEFSLEMFAEDRFARLPGFGTRSEPGFRKVYGFGLFREWGF
jgi:autotransporter translocation and assembly factor TamB